MTLMNCPDCQGKLSDRAFACPHCGFPMVQQKSKSPWPGVIGGVAGTYISSQALISIVLGSVVFIAFAAIMIALIMR